MSPLSSPPVHSPSPREQELQERLARARAEALTALDLVRAVEARLALLRVDLIGGSESQPPGSSFRLSSADTLTAISRHLRTPPPAGAEAAQVESDAPLPFSSLCPVIRSLTEQGELDIHKDPATGDSVWNLRPLRDKARVAPDQSLADPPPSPGHNPSAETAEANDTPFPRTPESYHVS